MSYLYRCIKTVKGKRCWTRKALPRRVEEYTRKPCCPKCGTELHYLDRSQMEKNKETTCNCDGLHYPHRAGSSVWCKLHPTGPTEADYRERHGDDYTNTLTMDDNDFEIPESTENDFWDFVS